MVDYNWMVFGKLVVIYFIDVSIGCCYVIKVVKDMFSYLRNVYVIMGD